MNDSDYARGCLAGLVFGSIIGWALTAITFWAWQQ